jgi:hypothetical protein
MKAEKATKPNKSFRGYPQIKGKNRFAARTGNGLRALTSVLDIRPC